MLKEVTENYNILSVVKKRYVSFPGESEVNWKYNGVDLRCYGIVKDRKATLYCLWEENNLHTYLLVC